MSVDGRQQDWEIRLLFDGACPLCAKEVAVLGRLDRARDRILFEDISRPDFDASLYGLDPESAMSRMHGVLPDGTVVEGMEVFRRAYSAVGLGWLLAPTRWPGIRTFADAAYRLFARNRLRLTGRARQCGPGGACATPGA